MPAVVVAKIHEIVNRFVQVSCRAQALDECEIKREELGFDGAYERGDEPRVWIEKQCERTLSVLRRRATKAGAKPCIQCLADHGRILRLSAHELNRMSIPHTEFVSAVGDIVLAEDSRR